MKWLNIFTYYSLCMFHSILTKMLDTPCVGYIMQNVCRIWGQQIHCGSNETQISAKNRFGWRQMPPFWDQFRPTQTYVSLNIDLNAWYTLCRVHNVTYMLNMGAKHSLWIEWNSNPHQKPFLAIPNVVILGPIPTHTNVFFTQYWLKCLIHLV